METIYESAAQTAKKIRASLKSSFPGVKFSVRSSRYSGGSSIHIGWTDGPLGRQVEQVAKVYQGSTFDGMIDLKTHHGYTDPSDGKHYSGPDFVFCERALSDAKRAEREQRLRDYFTPEDAERLLEGPSKWYWLEKLEARALGLEKD